MSKRDVDWLDPEAVGKALREIEWGYQSNSGHVVAYFCPMCAAMVPSGGSPVSSKELHIIYHVTMAKNMSHIMSRR